MTRMLEGSFWVESSSKAYPLHHICPYQGSFPPQLPAFFLNNLPSQVVLDPFAGRGTVLLEASLRGKEVYGVDISPVALALSEVKIHCATRAEVLEEIASLDLSGSAPEPPEEVAPFYHSDTWAQVYHLQQSHLSPTLKALALGRLHGHSPGFFSVKTFNVLSVTGDSLQRAQDKHGVQENYRKDIQTILDNAARKFIPLSGIRVPGKVFDSDARNIPLPDKSVDLIITSPPFLDVIDYAQVNWLRLWFLQKQDPPDTFITSEQGYLDFLRGVLRELGRVLKPDGTIVFEVGPVKRNLRLYDVVMEAAKGIFRVELVIRHTFGGGVPKISRAMHGGQETTTMSNDCVVLRHKDSDDLNIDWQELPKQDSGVTSLEDLFGLEG